MYHPIHLTQGLRYFAKSIQQKVQGPKRYPGNAHDICNAIIKACWNGTYFMTSTHHYQEFWARDFAYCTESLIKLGHRNKVISTLSYALTRWQKTRITTTITKNGTPYNFPNIYSPDSIALTIHALRVANAKKIVKKHQSFLQKEITHFANTVLENGRVKRGVHLSGMRDYARHDSSCYTHCMAILLAREANTLGFSFPYTEKELINTLNEYWTGTHYRDDRRITEASGDANTIPYLLGIGKHFSKAHKTIQHKQLDNPFPLAYSNHPHTHMIWTEFFVPAWQHHTIWPLLGLLFCHAIKKENNKLCATYKQQYTTIIERYGTLYEVYDKQGKPYQSTFYHADEGMIWAALYLTL